MDNDLIAISSLQDRYSLNSRQAIYDRIAALKITPVARGKLSSVQVDKLSFIQSRSLMPSTVESGLSAVGERSEGRSGKPIKFLNSVESDANPQRKLEVIATIKKSLRIAIALVTS